jgi:hypothetical protein
VTAHTAARKGERRRGRHDKVNAMSRREYAMRFRSRTTLAVIAVAAAVAIPGTAYSGTGPDLRTVTVTSGRSTAAKTLTATCDAGYVATGAQAVVPGNPYGVHVTEIWPSGRTVRVTAEVFSEVTPKPNWAVTVIGICVPRPSGYTTVQGDPKIADRTTDDGSRYGELSFALCPTGKELIGMGGRATGGYLDHLQPLGKGVPYTNDFDPLMHGVTVIGKARVGAATSARVRAIAVCANAGNGSTFAHAETHNTGQTKSVTATCPANTRIRAAGFVIFYPNHFADNTPFSYATLSRAEAADGGLTSMQLVAMRHRDTIVTEEWGLVPQLLCAT